MSLMHFYAQMGMTRLGPLLMSMPDELDADDRALFTERFRSMEQTPEKFERMFVGLSEGAIVEKIGQMAEAFMDELYPPPTMQVYHSFRAVDYVQKDYYLPALKVLNFRDGDYWSPARTARWKNFELKAEHLDVEDRNIATRTYVVRKDNTHKVGMTCDCGIYGSVNTEEINLYLNTDGMSSLIQMDPNYLVQDRRLVIIEPSNGADVFIARKGWKTTKAFISEIVGDTISIADASELLSMVWKRKIDVHKVYLKKVNE